MQRELNGKQKYYIENAIQDTLYSFCNKKENLSSIEENLNTFYTKYIENDSNFFGKILDDLWNLYKKDPSHGMEDIFRFIDKLDSNSRCYISNNLFDLFCGIFIGKDRKGNSTDKLPFDKRYMRSSSPDNRVDLAIINLSSSNNNHQNLLKYKEEIIKEVKESKNILLEEVFFGLIFKRRWFMILNWNARIISCNIRLPSWCSQYNKTSVGFLSLSEETYKIKKDITNIFYNCLNYKRNKFKLTEDEKKIMKYFDDYSYSESESPEKISDLKIKSSEYSSSKSTYINLSKNRKFMITPRKNYVERSDSTKSL